MDNTKQTYKLTDEEFIEAYRICNGNCALTANYIQQNYKMPYSRQAVYKRAKNFPDLKLKDVALFANECHSGLVTFAGDENNDVRLRARIYLQLMNKLNGTLKRAYRFANAKNLFTESL